jgi:Zn-dependent peptidase ImmA (M78 family)
LNPKDELIKKLCARWNAPSSEMAIAEALRAAFPRLHEFSLPIRLSQLAPLRKVAEICKKPLSCDGIISIKPSGTYLIEVNSDHKETRRRFTIAHELGHTFFFDVDGEIRQRVRDTNLNLISRSDREETLCNYAAAQILMPPWQFDPLVRQIGPSADGVLRLARNFNVSPQAISWRLVQRFNLRIVVALWEYNPDRESYESNWLTSFFSSHQANVKQLTIAKSDPAFKFLHEHDAYRGQAWISLGGPMDAYFVDAVAWSHRDKRKLLTVFVLDRNPEAILATRVPAESRDPQLSLF